MPEQQQTTTPLDARTAGQDTPDLDEMVAAWLADLRPSTRKGYRATIRAVRRELRLIEMDLLDSPQIVAQVAAAVAERGADGGVVSLSTAVQRASRVSAFFRWAQRRGLVLHG